MPDDMNDTPTNGHTPPPTGPRLTITFAAPGSMLFTVAPEGDVHPMQMAAVALFLEEQARGWVRGALREQLAPRVVRPGLG